MAIPIEKIRFALQISGHSHRASKPMPSTPDTALIVIGRIAGYTDCANDLSLPENKHAARNRNELAT